MSNTTENIGEKPMVQAEKPHFVKEMTVAEAMKTHPEVSLVFSSYHLGGCSHCSIKEVETIEQVCQGYGVDVDNLLDSLNGLIEG